jgi:DNA-binding CsgD family transcriptional regulator
LKQVFGLTAAQAKVAQMLASGKSLVAIAKALGITHETARFHLKHAMQKTGTSHQAELVKKVLGLSANTTGS